MTQLTPSPVESAQDLPARKLPVIRKRTQILLVAAALLGVYAAVYPREIDLSGDQTAQVVAAQSMLNDGTYRVSLHDAYGGGVVVNIGDDLRQPLRWFPPGYSLLLYVFGKCGSSIASSALLIHYLAKFLWMICWLVAGLGLGLPFATILCAVAFLLFLTYPSTTTDLFESIAVALVFLSASRYSGSRTGTVLASVSMAAGILFRYATVKLAGFFSLLELIRRPSRATFLRLALTLAPAAGVYLFCIRVLGSDSTPYHRAGPTANTHWHLLMKGVYYAITGGWSPANAVLKGALIVFIVTGSIGFLRLRARNGLPQWIWLLVSWQAFCFLFLIGVQLRYGSMYAANEPAFVTPRFYTLAQPLNVAALLMLAPFGFPRLHSVSQRLLAAMLFFCAVDWVAVNQASLRDRSRGTDGFLRPTDLDAVHRLLQSRIPDAIFNGAGVFLYTAADSRMIYPDTIRALRAPKDCSIAVVHFAADRSRLLTALEKKVSPYEAHSLGTFEVHLFKLARGFELTIPGS